MSNILLLGPGTSRHRYHSEKLFGTDRTEAITVADRSQAVLDDWPEARMTLRVDLRKPPFPFPASYYDEVHAYEVLNLLPGDEIVFFEFWQQIWNCMRFGGRVFATTPHWQSQWIHAYPGAQRTYTPGLLTYLDHEASVSAKEDFGGLWPRNRNFRLVEAQDLMVTGEPQGFHFILEKA